MGEGGVSRQFKGNTIQFDFVADRTALMPKKRDPAGNKSDNTASKDDDDMYNLPLIPQTRPAHSLSSGPASKKNQSQQLRPAPESESDEIESVPNDADSSSGGNSSEDNHSDDGIVPEPGTSSTVKVHVHDKR